MEMAEASSPRSRISATQEIRQLRAQVKAMEDVLETLQFKWIEQLPDSRSLQEAHHLARIKYRLIQTQNEHSELENAFVRQQLMYASLQTTILQAPLYSNSEELMMMLQFQTRLGRESKERQIKLLAHFNRSLATIPSSVNKITQTAIDKALGHRKEGDTKEPLTPLSQINITGLVNSTLISSVFMLEIPNATLKEVYEAILVSYIEAIPALMQRHFGIHATRKMLDSADSPAIYYRLDLHGNDITSSMNHVICSELTSSYGMVHVDSIIDDALHPVSRTNSLQYIVSGITITPRIEAATGKTLSVRLQRVLVYHYNLLPGDSALMKDLAIIRPVLNGDLITSSVCEYIKRTNISQE
ncbi:hypothetical protein CCR75_004174 [Bremia lactucae]|uniref:Uncharacterized protein n=1 Tax=Bremia lactucae TaxID=4779 RepID=A0A976FLP4_BRELC|nr:hypothetical protein CCR75_004174 [Bremia lactucae]